jgi:SAM-dependent methyltransferase
VEDIEKLIEYVKNDRFIPIPDGERIFTGGDLSDFVQIGTDILRSLVLFGGANPSSKILEIGSGIGRAAIPLTQLLKTGSYTGTDIVFQGLAWCQENISKYYPNFSFHHYDIENEFYNPTGQGRIEDIRLPAVDGGYDLVFLASVFTHLTTADAEAYLPRIYEALAPGAKLWGSWFIIDEDIGDAILDGRAKVPVLFKCDDGAFYTTPQKGTLAVAFREDVVRSMLERAGFKITYVQHGDWCGPRRQFNGGLQDLIVAEKPL